MANKLSEFYDEFQEELSDAIMRLEDLSEQTFCPNSRQYTELFRAIHTIKGNCMFLEKELHPQIDLLLNFTHLFESYLTRLGNNNKSVVDPAALLIVADLFSDFISTKIKIAPGGYKRAISFIESILPQKTEVPPTTRDSYSREGVNSLWSIIYLNLNKGEFSDMLDILRKSIDLNHFNPALSKALVTISTAMNKAVEASNIDQFDALRVACDQIFCFTLIIIRSSDQNKDYQTFVEKALHMLTSAQNQTATPSRRKSYDDSESDMRLESVVT